MLRVRPVFFMSAFRHSDSVYVREARVDEYDTIVRLIAHAFLHCPITNWCGSLSQLIPLPEREQIDNDPISKFPKHVELSYYLRYALLVSVHLANGHITVVARKLQDGSEKIVSVASWLPPGATTGTIPIILESKRHRAFFGTLRRPGGWGFNGLQVR